MFVFVVLYVAYAVYHPYPFVVASYINKNERDTGQAVIPWPAYGQAAIGAVGYGVLSSSKASKAVPVASTAKIMTALAVLKKHPLALNDQGPMLTMTDSDVQLYNDYIAKAGSVVNVVAGEQISEYQALQAVLLASGNNMADSIARWAFGSMQNYLDYANQLSKNLKMNQTHFATDASGYSPDSVSTAEDLVRLGLAAIQEPVLAQIVGQGSADITVGGHIPNTNTMLGKSDIVGIKTGHTDQAGSCFLFAATHSISGAQNVTVIGAVLGAPDLQVAFKDTLGLLDASYGGFVSKAIVKAGQIVAEYRTPWSSIAPVIAQNDVTTLTWRGANTKPKISFDRVQPPAEANKRVGTISADSGAQHISSPLVLKDKISRPNIWYRLTHPF